MSVQKAGGEQGNLVPGWCQHRNYGVPIGKNFRFLAWVCHQVIYRTSGKALNFSASCFSYWFPVLDEGPSSPVRNPSLTCRPLPPTSSGAPSRVDSILELSLETAHISSSATQRLE